MTRLDEGFFLKTFSPESWRASLKDGFRHSKARRAQQVSRALTAAGLYAPLAMAAGEKRNNRLLSRAFLVTLPVAGVSLIDFLRDCHAGKKSIPFAKKHAALRQLARVIRRFHDLGFVHGDLLPTNIFVVQRDNHDLDFYFMDNDRTRRYPRRTPQLLWRRNLVQLNRMPLPGISLQDRMLHWRAGWKGKRASGAFNVMRSRAAAVFAA
jgi:tRNA A-37 threonylcarbamoyl transferase component Bud32